MSMPREWIDRLFERLAAIYGRQWIGKWEGVDWEAVKAAWAHELRDVSADGLRHALDNLPDHAPNAVEFRRLCRVPVRHLGGDALAELPAPAADPKRVREAIAKLRELKLWRVR